ncbi:MAG: DUF4240 domain-containing protein, partial [Chitinophagaceae bacterium]
MGIFNRIFGSGRSEEGPSSFDGLMSEGSFWLVIASTFDQAGGNYDQQQDELAIALKKLSLQELVAFDNRFRQLRGQAYRWDLWGAIYIIHGGCGDDSFSDFRGWLICQGKVLYYSALKNPETLITVSQEKIETDWEGASYIATSV